jgi:hypothetical protein
MTSHLLDNDEALTGVSSGGAPSFTTSAGLRALLDRLHAAGRGAWRTDPDAAALLAYTITRYQPLTRAWHRDPADAATAAFLAMIHDGVRRAGDPWAVVTRAVQVSLAAENHAERHLTSTEKARRAQHADLPVPVRAGEYTDVLLTAAEPGPGDRARSPLQDSDCEAAPTGDVTTAAAELLVTLGWPAAVASPAVQYVSTRLADAGSVPAAYEALRRDTALRGQLDLDRAAWTGLLGLLLGARPQPGRLTRRGMLARLLLGETVTDLLADEQVVRAVTDALPQRTPAALVPPMALGGGGWRGEDAGPAGG